MVSRELAKTKRDLSELRKDALMLEITDASQIHAVSLPTYGELQWRWKIHLPTDGKFRINYSVGKIPLKGFGAESTKMNAAFLGSDGKPLPGEKPFILDLSINKSVDRWLINANNGDRGTGIYIVNPPEWLESYTPTGWSSSVAGRRETLAADPNGPFELLRMRKSKAVPGGSTVDEKPADGVHVWLERIN